MHMRTLFPATLFILCLSACAKDEPATDPTQEADPPTAGVTACYDHCEAQEEAGCGIEEGVETCKEGCDFIVGVLNDTCDAAAAALFKCNIDNDELCAVVEEDSKCTEEFDAYQACLQ